VSELPLARLSLSFRDSVRGHSGTLAQPSVLRSEVFSEDDALDSLLRVQAEAEAVKRAVWLLGAVPPAN
jgi:hypothetical protein